jgi:hypothetical protein
VIETILALVKRFPIWIALGVFALGGYLFRDYLSGSAGDLKVGDCFDVPSLQTQGAMVKDVQHHPCSELHSGEVYFKGNVPGDANAAYPADDAFDAFARDRCVPEYRGYTGRDFDSDETYDIQYLTPTTDGWKDGDRTVDCIVLRIDGQSFKGSVKAAR